LFRLSIYQNDAEMMRVHISERFYEHEWWRNLLDSRSVLERWVAIK